MKLKAIIPILFVCLVYSSSYSFELRVGLTTGVNISSLSKSDFSQFDIETKKPKKLAIGVFFEQKFSSYSILREEISLSLLGENWELQGSPIEDYLVENKLKYLQLNYLYKHLLSRNSKTTPYFFVGPSLNINKSYVQKITIVNSSSDFAGQSIEEDIDNIKHYYYAMIFGGGLNISYNKLQFNLEGRYFHGFSTIFSKHEYSLLRDYYAIFNRDTGEIYEWSNRAFSFLIGVSIKL